MKKSWLLVLVFGVIVLAMVAGLWSVRRVSPEQSPASAARTIGENQTRAIIEKKRPKTGARTARAPKPVLDLTRPGEDGDDPDDTRTSEEKRLASCIEKALDDENLKEALACASEALVCTNIEIRQAMVDTLGWFGAKALPELTPFMADPDEDVADSARNEWTTALSEIEDEAEKLTVAELAMNTMKDEDTLEDISSEYIGVDEKLAVESLLRIIEAEGTPEGIAKAKETYEFVTGEEFTDRAAAEKWIAEEYQPNEEPDDSCGR